jgi:hypothetical protein
MGLVEEVLDRDGELPWKLDEPVAQRFNDIVSQRVAFHALDAFTKSLRLVVEVVKDDLLQSEPAELRDSVELGRVERDVRNQWKGWVALEESSDCADVHDPIRRRVEDYDTDRLASDEGFKFLP